MDIETVGTLRRKRNRERNKLSYLGRNETISALCGMIEGHKSFTFFLRKSKKLWNILEIPGRLIFIHD
jgi:hypothetical protein